MALMWSKLELVNKMNDIIILYEYPEYGIRNSENNINGIVTQNKILNSLNFIVKRTLNKFNVKDISFLGFSMGTAVTLKYISEHLQMRRTRNQSWLLTLFSMPEVLREL